MFKCKVTSNKGNTVCVCVCVCHARSDVFIGSGLRLHAMLVFLFSLLLIDRQLHFAPCPRGRRRLWMWATSPRRGGGGRRPRGRPEEWLGPRREEPRLQSALYCCKQDRTECLILKIITQTSLSSQINI